MSSQDYSLKSRNQRTTARVLLIGGGLVAGTVVYATLPGKSVSLDVLPLVGGVGVAGGLAALGSIPLFIAAGRNRRKAAPIAQVEVGTLAAPAYAGATPVFGPTLGLRISL
ncbi:hypothetical protein GCM10022406_15450 [Hymenobacter algoricola]|uniref:Uncharacterized protein n=2 Tax=Hymenobacter algoricola TaxID=486267 RepID=A0ABP7MVC6_9BACT